MKKYIFIRDVDKEPFYLQDFKLKDTSASASYSFLMSPQPGELEKAIKMTPLLKFTFELNKSLKYTKKNELLN